MSKIFLIVSCLLLGICSASSAEKCDRRFRVAVNAYQPFYSVDHYGQVSGLTYDIVKDLEKRLGCTLQQQPAVAPRMLEDFKSWRTDIIAFIGVNDMFSRSGNFIELYSVHRRLVVINSSFVLNKKINEYVADQKIKFAGQIGTHPYITNDEIDILKKQNRIIQVPSPEVAYKMLMNGRLQAFFTSPVVHNYNLKTKKDLKDKVTAISDPGFKNTVGLYLSKKRINAEEARHIKAAVEDMRSDGSLRKLVLKYIRPEDLQDYEFKLLPSLSHK
jgi:polar amino acid transport system substrate-binding protein